VKRAQKNFNPELGLEHSNYSLPASPKPYDFSIIGDTDETISIVVDGDQIVMGK